MQGKKSVTGIWLLLLTVSMLAGGFASAALASRLTGWEGGLGLVPLVLGAVFGGIGWFLAENIGDAAFLLLITGSAGAVVLAYLQSQTLRLITVAFLCGFNIGKICGGIYREYRDFQ